MHYVQYLYVYLTDVHQFIHDVYSPYTSNMCLMYKTAPTMLA